MVALSQPRFRIYIITLQAYPIALLQAVLSHLIQLQLFNFVWRSMITTQKLALQEMRRPRQIQKRLPAGIYAANFSCTIIALFIRNALPGGAVSAFHFLLHYTMN